MSASGESAETTRPAQPGQPLLEFLAVMRRLRSDCAWKAEQTHRSLARYLLEETHETLEAIDTGDAELLREELGDLLLQVYFHAVIAEEAGEFTIDDVAGDVIAKMVRRNPHVFGPGGAAADPSRDGPTGDGPTWDGPTWDGSAATGPAPLEPAEINEVWEAIKATEKQRTSVTDGLPETLPALLYADKVLDRLARAGRTPDPGGGVQATVSTAESVADAPPPAGAGAEVEIGERLLTVVAQARAAGVDPEQALRDAVRRLL